MKGPSKELISLRDKLQAAHGASESRKLDSQHYREVDAAIAKALEQLPPVYCCGSSDSDESFASETKQEDGSPMAAEESSPAKALQVMLPGHEGSARSIPMTPDALGIDIRVGIDAKVDGPASQSARDELKKQFKRGDQVLFCRRGTAAEHARVKSVHTDDEVPYYTISTDSGREINTDDDHLQHRQQPSFPRMVRHGSKAAADGIEGGDFGKDFHRNFIVGSEKIAQGTTTNVYEGTMRRKSKKGYRYAIKKVGGWQLRKLQKEEMIREMGILKVLKHPNIVKAYQLYPTPRAYYMVLEYLSGGELFDGIVRKESYSEREARDVCKVLVDAVSHLHDKSIVHRDLKPGSILLANPGGNEGAATTSTATPPAKVTTSPPKVTSTTREEIRGNMNVTTTRTTTVTTVVTTTPVVAPARVSSDSLKITDFGKARSVCEGPIKSTFVKSEFSAPEMLMREAHGKPVDMWSLGLISHILLSGNNPFFHEDEQQMFLRVAKGAFEYKPEIWGSISPEAKDFVAKLLKVDPEKRMTAQEAKSHPWLHAAGESLGAGDLRGNLEGYKVLDAKRKLRALMKTLVAAKRLVDSLEPTKPDLSKYAFVKKLGEGAYGQVFKATRIASGDAGATGVGAAPRYIAVKSIRKEGLSRKETRDIINEAKIMRELNHPNVVSIYGFYEDDPKYFYLALELMEGGELLDRIVQKTYYNEAEARDVCVPLLGAVEYLHSQGIVHRNLKPENLLLASASDATSIRLADFGFAASIRDGDLIDGCGTPFYVAPEMLKNVPYGTSVDMWSIGVIIFILLAGRPPFHGRNQNLMFRNIKSGAYEFEEDFWMKISGDAKDLITRLLTVDPAKRLTANEACKHPWLTTDAPNLSCHKLSARLNDLKVFNAMRKLRAAVKTVGSTQPSWRRLINK